MPELPEVETIRGDLDLQLRGARLESVTVSRRWKSLPHTRFHENRSFERRLRGTLVERVDRRSKYLLFQLQPPATLIVHLGMSGQLLLVERSAPRELHTHAVFRIDRGHELRFTDPRMFGRLWLVGADEVEQKIGPLGPEPLSAAFTWRVLATKFAKKQAPVKAALLDMKVVAGVGNIYSDEALFEAGVHPLRACASLTPDELKQLAAHLKSVLRRAVKSRGTTLSDARYADVFGEYGGHVPKVYGRAGAPCLQCGTAVVRGVLGNRGYHFCPRCQR